MNQQHTQPQHQPTRHRARRVVQQQQPPRKTKSKPSFWARLIKFAVVAFLAYALVPMSWLHAAAIDWSYTPDYQLSIERCMARETGESYGLMDESRNCMNHNGFMPLVKDGRLIGWQGASGTFPKATTAGMKS